MAGFLFKRLNGAKRAIKGMQYHARRRIVKSTKNYEEHIYPEDASRAYGITNSERHGEDQNVPFYTRRLATIDVDLRQGDYTVAAGRIEGDAKHLINDRKVSDSAKMKLAQSYANRAVRSSNAMEKYFKEGGRDSRTLNAYDAYQERLDKTLDSLERSLGITPHRELLRLSGLEEHSAVAAAIIGIVSGLLFMVPAITGNVIGNGTSSVIGAVLLISGLIAGFYSLKRRKKYSRHIKPRKVGKRRSRRR
ncbi:MAG: DUF308 domain-containing protein [Candidatus Nanoarchaeia archaeon]|nr:DUF308 domain-containing protein [Candidatus Nanoarchaeia archaeon]